MKLKLLLRGLERVLIESDTRISPQPDMHLPKRLLAMAMLFFSGGIALGIYCIFRFAVWAVIAAVLGVLFGIFAFLCWRNQAIYVISDEEFVYSTMFGRKHTYSFQQIRGLRRNGNSLTLLVAGKKVHIEAMAVLSQRLIDSINHALHKEPLPPAPAPQAELPATQEEEKA